jgi:CheY-like chemotaxis protein/HPt (histidine-containing phosphotransfer) domain-containing protein
MTGAEVLGKELAESLEKFKTNGEKQLKRSQVVFEPMPYGKVLVVDDVESNLYVAKGLMSPYGLSIETAPSGFDAITKIKGGNAYDIVFMDHMMPEMDGIETTKKIREMGYGQPIIALTANAVVGQSDIFLANGFDSFISKPIDIRQLNTALKKFVRDKQPPEVIEAALRHSEQAAPPDQSAAEPEIDPELAELFVRDARKAIATLEAILEKSGAFAEEDTRTYTINTHGIKSALANIGETDLSAAALALEKAGKANDIAVMIAETPAFLGRLKALIEKLS